MLGPFIFLDIDGVLNHHVQHSNRYCKTCEQCVMLFNQLLANVPDAKIVLVSAWRYYVHRGEMTIAGINGLLATIGVTWGRVVDVVGPDRTLNQSRGTLIKEWLAASYGLCHPVKYVILDDMDLDYDNMPFFKVPNGLCTECFGERFDMDAVRKALQ